MRILQTKDTAAQQAESVTRRRQLQGVRRHPLADFRIDNPAATNRARAAANGGAVASGRVTGRVT
jgi:hypothetical protein